MLFIMPANIGMNILGMPLHIDYYTVHDPVKGTVGWAPHKDSTKGQVVSGPPPKGDKMLRVTRDEVQLLPWYATLIVSTMVAILSFMTWERWFVPWLNDTRSNKTMRAKKIYSAMYFACWMFFTVWALFPVLKVIWFTGDKEDPQDLD